MDRIHTQRIQEAIEAGSQVIKTIESFEALLDLPDDTRAYLIGLLNGTEEYNSEEFNQIWLDT